MPTFDNAVSLSVGSVVLYFMFWMHKTVNLFLTQSRREAEECRSERLSLAAAHAVEREKDQLERDRYRREREKDREFQVVLLADFKAMILGGRPIDDNDIPVRPPGNYRGPTP